MMMKKPVTVVGVHLVTAAAAIDELSPLVTALAPQRKEAQDAGQRMGFAAEKMRLAGNNLQGIAPKKPAGKSWLKGGL